MDTGQWTDTHTHTHNIEDPPSYRCRHLFPVPSLLFSIQNLFLFEIVFCVCASARLCEIQPKNWVQKPVFFSLFFWFDNFYFIFIRYKYDFFTQIYEASYRLCVDIYYFFFHFVYNICYNAVYNTQYTFSYQQIWFDISQMRTGSIEFHMKMGGRIINKKTMTQNV